MEQTNWRSVGQKIGKGLVNAQSSMWKFQVSEYPTYRDLARDRQNVRAYGLPTIRCEGDSRK
jgi:hypothetical protein